MLQTGRTTPKPAIWKQQLLTSNWFGSQSQIELVLKFAEEFAKTGGANLDELLEDLRHDLRKELGLEIVSKNIKHLRIIPKLGKRNRNA